MTDTSPDNKFASASTAAAPISRRTVLAGTALAVPAVVLTASAPAVAASGLALNFEKSSYSGQGCTTISGAKVSASDNGAPKAGASVTVSLSNGYTFSTGGTSSTGVTGTDGARTLPDINVPAGGGSGTATATSSGATSTTASLISTGAQAAAYISDGTESQASGVPRNSKPVAGGLWLTSDGRIVDGLYNGQVRATNVASFGQIFRETNTTWYLPLTNSDGSATYISGGGPQTNAANVPAGSTPVAGGLWLTSAGQIVDGLQGGQVVATNVSSFGQIYRDPNTTWYIPLKNSDGSATYISGGGPQTSASNVPTGSTPIAGGLWLASGGQIVDGLHGGQVVANNVSSFGQIYRDPKTSWYVPLKNSDGSATYISGSGPQSSATNVPNNSTPVAGGLWLSPGGQLVDGLNGGSAVGSAIKSFGQIYRESSGGWYLPLSVAATDC
ncbi:hypothetical protein [Microbacterium testaceum]|uniref:hypothetical protein n=1 Tax=Microbacterium testaceum TaxID=2033 RepID=UPI0012AC8BDC|nr:hypothetical protein [Microbacterium testaceum]